MSYSQGGQSGAWCAQRQLRRVHHQRTLSVPGARSHDPKWLSEIMVVTCRYVSLPYVLPYVTMNAAKRDQNMKISSFWQRKELGQNLNVTIEKNSIERLSDHVFWGIFGVEYIKEEAVRKSIAGMPSRCSFTQSCQLLGIQEVISEAERNISQNHMKSW